MAQARSTDGGIDPDRINNRSQMAAALKEVKGSRSYRQLTEAAEDLTPSAARRAGAGSGPTWTPEPLPRGTVSDWLAERSLPARNKLLTFLTACGVPADRWSAWVEAVSRVKIAAPGRTIAEHDPIQLGVHAAIHVDPGHGDEGGDLDVLPPYVVRDHDHRLRESLRDGRGNQLVVLVGGSSVGKTRTCYEAVREVLSGWPVLHPLTAEELLAVLADGVTPGTVLWLNETQRYLQPPYGRDVAAALQGLLSRPVGTGTGRVVVLGSMWLNPYWLGFTRLPQRGNPHDEQQVRDLLTQFCVRVNVAEDFHAITDDQRAELRRLAEQDPRLAVAIDVGGESLRITQAIAGGPLLAKRYTDLEAADPAAYAVLTVAMDARRIGYQSPLPSGLLEQAAASYLTPAQRATNGGWLPAALDIATEEIHGVRALTPVRTAPGIGEADGYVLADYLDQYARADRARILVPAATWDRLAENTTDPDDRFRLARAARDRSLYRIATRLLTPAAETGSVSAMRLLAELLGQAGHNEEMNAWRATAYTLDNREEEGIPFCSATMKIVDARTEVALLEIDLCCYMDAKEWWPNAELTDDDRRKGARLGISSGKYIDMNGWFRYTGMRGDQPGTIREVDLWGLTLLAETRHDGAVEQHWHSRAASGEINAMRLLARLLALNGHNEEAKQWLHCAAETGNAQHAVPSTMRDLAHLLQRTGRGGEGGHWLQRAADAGDLDATCELLECAGRGHEAEQRLRHAVEEGNQLARFGLLERLQRTGRTEEAQRLQQFGIEPGGLTAEPW